MSLESESPSPVPWSVGLVVKNGLKIFSMTSGGMPIPLSRMRTSRWSSSRFVFSQIVGEYGPPAISAPGVATRRSFVA